MDFQMHASAPFILEQMIDIRRKEVQEFIQKQKSKEVELKDQ